MVQLSTGKMEESIGHKDETGKILGPETWA